VPSKARTKLRFRDMRKKIKEFKDNTQEFNLNTSESALIPIEK
jgi:hypothetical protein